MTGWCKHGSRTHDRRHLKPLLLPTELACWRPRPRPRAVHASAIQSARAPGGTHEPAPLTRLPSRPRYGAARRCRTRPNGTRGRSRTCVLWVQSPTGMPATHDSCAWIRRQESDLRGLRSERSWDASNPHLNNWRASKELHPTSGLWRPVPRYEDRPKLAERGEPETQAASGTVCFPDSPRTLPGSRSQIGGRRSVSIHTPLRMPLAFETRVHACALHLPVLAEAERVERSRPLRGHRRVQAD